MQERGLCNTLEEGCHPAGHNTSPGQLFVSLDKVSLASRIGNGNFGEVCRVITEIPRFTVISAITEFERSLISERVRAGIAKARANRTRHGRPKLDHQIIQEIRRLRTEGQSLHQIARTLRISHQAVANYAPPQPKTRR
jgi:hypothetical protein